MKCPQSIRKLSPALASTGCCSVPTRIASIPSTGNRSHFTGWSGVFTAHSAVASKYSCTACGFPSIDRAWNVTYVTGRDSTSRSSGSSGDRNDTASCTPSPSKV